MNEAASGSVWQAWTPRLRSIVRIAASAMFMLAGSSKLFAFPAGLPPHGDTAILLSELGVAGILEVFGGALLLVGLFTRPVAFLLSGEMAVAYFPYHFTKGLWPTLNGGVAAAPYRFILLY